MQKITPFLWYDGQAEEAARFYTSIFKNSRVLEVSRYGRAGPMPEGMVMTVTFELDGQRLVALNGGPAHRFTDAISLFVSCQSQDEVDELWSKLSDGGEEGRCGWLTDKYGLSWQIVPTDLPELLSDPDPDRSSRVMRAMLGMRKLDLKALQDAYQGRAADDWPA